MEFVGGGFGWSEWSYKGWYLLGAYFAAANLGMGTAYMLLPRTAAHVIFTILLTGSIMAAWALIAAPADLSLAVQGREITGAGLPAANRAVSAPFNIFGTVFLVGGAIWSAAAFFIRWTRSRRQDSALRTRALANVLIAIGGTMPALGGTLAKYGDDAQFLFASEFLGILIIFAGFLATGALKELRIPLTRAALYRRARPVTRRNRFRMAPSPLLVVHALGGNVTVRAGSPDSIEVVAALSDEELVRLEVDQIADCVVVDATASTESSRARRSKADLRLTVPTSCGLKLLTSDGVIAVKGLDGVRDLKTSRGRNSVTVSALGVTIRSSRGDVSFTGRLDQDARGEIETFKGDVTVDLRDTLDLVLNATTGRGEVITRRSVAISEDRGAGSLVGVVGKGGAELTIRTDRGPVTIV